MRVGIDLDGVLANFDQAFLGVLNWQTGHNRKLDGGAQRWNWAIEQLGFTGREVATAWDYIQSTEGLFWQMVMPLDGAIQAIKRLDMLNRTGQADIYFITLRQGQGVKLATESWLENLGFFNPTVLLASGNTKGLVAAALDLDIIIDDLPLLLQGVWRMGARARTYLVKRPYNSEAWGVSKVHLVESINEMLDIEFGKEDEREHERTGRVDGAGGDAAAVAAAYTASGASVDGQE